MMVEKGEGQATVLRLILGDQLNEKHSWYQKVNPQVVYVMMEMKQETGYVKHHIQKIIGFFKAMRAFAKILTKAGHRLHYLKLDDPANHQRLSENIIALIAQYQASKFDYQLPDEYRLDQQLEKLANELTIPVEAFTTEHFLTQRMEVAQFFAGKKTFLLESFYRHMRKKYEILMEPDGASPLTGKWNYDHSNRKKLPKDLTVPPTLHFYKDVSEIADLLQRMDIETIGHLVDATKFDWPVTRTESLQLFQHFLEVHFANFGTYQDAMTTKERWLFHSRLSFAMNTKMVSPLEVVQGAATFWYDHQDKIDIAQAEGFIRQILGWREYMRGIYWAKMPDFASMNYFNHTEQLPDWYWTGHTKMKCLNHTINQSLDVAYAHHIQRLMVTGNFALLLGVHPDEVDQWYLGIYMDAIEWVEITNTRGMSQFADGGIVGTKPYVSSANYIHKMGDYCSQCAYDRKKKYGTGACPFNSLYWDFYDRHRDKLGNNPRIGMMYRVWDKNNSEEKTRILAQAASYKAQKDAL